MIHLVGLGPGGADALPPRARLLLTQTRFPVFLRTARHPVVTQEPLASVVFAAFDDVYENEPSFEAVYDTIVQRVLAAHDAQGEVVYAVPGHPLVGEATTARLLPLAREKAIPVAIVGAPSFVDACLEALGEAVTDNLAIVDALALNADEPTPLRALRTNGPLLLYQVHSRLAASNVKLALMRAGYPDAFVVSIIWSAGVAGEQRVWVTPLHQMDRSDAFDHLCSVWVPALPPQARRPDFDDLVGVMARLRDKNHGCPWDLKQTHQTLRPFVLEEAYEVADAIDADDPDALTEELGDLLLQVVFHAQLAGEAGTFEAGDVIQTIVEKLVRRHPHVFGDLKVETAGEVLANWNAIKAGEKNNAVRTSILDGIPRSLPALSQALETSQRAVKAGFEWADTSHVLDKVAEELAELRAEIDVPAPRAGRIADELGDLLFTLVNVARRVGIDPEAALRQQLTKFGRRFRHIEAAARARNLPLDALGIEAMEALWQEAKAQEKP